MKSYWKKRRSNNRSFRPKHSLLFMLATLSIILPWLPLWASADRDINDPYAQGLSLMEEKKYAEAAEKFARAIQEDPAFQAAYIVSAKALVLTGKRKEGLAQMAQAIKLTKRKKDTMKLKEQRDLFSKIFYTNATFQKYQDGLNNMQGMKLRAAIESFEQALATEPDNVEILIAYAKALQAVDDWKESVNVLEQALTFNPDIQTTRLLLGSALLSSNHERTLELLAPYIANPKRNEDITVLYAQALAKRGDMHGAISILQKDVDHHTENLRTLYWLGKYSSEIKENRWIARKHLQTFLRRVSHEKNHLEWKSLEQDARHILERIHSELGIADQPTKI